tara:strand:+ start:915 stop:1166 length:252 start_codon:yes stop_codon:yes gene_type:complete
VFSIRLEIVSVRASVSVVLKTELKNCEVKGSVRDISIFLNLFKTCGDSSVLDVGVVLDCVVLDCVVLEFIEEGRDGVVGMVFL